MQRRFYAVLANSLAAFMTNIYVWFAVTVWVYLETQSVIATSVMAGIYSITVAVSGFFLGSLVDRYPKKRVMLFAGAANVVCNVHITDRITVILVNYDVESVGKLVAFVRYDDLIAAFLAPKREAQ